MSTLLSGAKILLECLARENVECIFGYPGGVTLPLYDALFDNPIRHVLVRHEQNAAFEAQGYARSTGRVGVCCATSGPGATNLVTGLVDAMMDSIPIVALTGQVSTKLMGSDAFQEADTFGITRSAQSTTIWSRTSTTCRRSSTRRFTSPLAAARVRCWWTFRKTSFRRNAQYTPVAEIHLPGYKVYHEGHARPDPARGPDDVGSGAAVRVCGRRHHRGERVNELRASRRSRWMRRRFAR